MTRKSLERRLKPDEEILWEGRPRQGLIPNRPIEWLVFPVMFLLVPGFALLGMIALGLSPKTGFDAVFHWAWVLVPLVIAVIMAAIIMYQRRRTYYAVTNKRAYIRYPGSAMSRWVRRFEVLKPETRVCAKIGKRRSHILISQTRPGVQYAMRGKGDRYFQFWAIADGEEVLALIRSVQAGSLAGMPVDPIEEAPMLEDVPVTDPTETPVPFRAAPVVGTSGPVAPVVQAPVAPPPVAPPPVAAPRASEPPLTSTPAPESAAKDTAPAMPTFTSGRRKSPPLTALKEDTPHDNDPDRTAE